MRGTRSALLCLIVALAAGALMAPVASAAEYGPKEFPEIGRCVNVGVGNGTYRDAKCQFVARPGYGKTEWIPATQSEKITFSGGGSEATLKTLGHPTIKCIGENIHGEYLNEKQASVVIELVGCTDQSNKQCTQVAGVNKSEIASGSLTSELGFIKNVEKTIVVGMDFKPPFLQKALFTYECDGEKGLGEMNAIEGSVIAKYKPIQVMKEEMKMQFLATKAGLQNPEKFESGLKDTLVTSYGKFPNEKLGEGPTTLNIKEITGAYSQPVEIRLKEVPFS
jgi:hypothetical protein